MRIRVYSNGKFYLIECPAGTRVVRANLHDLLVVPSRVRKSRYRLIRRNCCRSWLNRVGAGSRWLASRCPT